MPFTRPTRSELVAEARAEIEARLPGADGRLRRSFLDVFARIVAGVAHGLYGLMDWIFRQAFPDTSEAEQLRRQASIFGVAEIPANFAAGEVEFTGTNEVTIPAGTTVRRADSVEFATTADVVISGGAVIAPVIAAAVGVDGNTGGGAVLSLSAAILGVDSTVTVEPEGFTGGTDPETDDALRSRLIDRLQRRPAGGTADDYIDRVREYAEVTDVFVHTGNDPQARFSHLASAVDSEVAGVWVARDLTPGVRLIVTIESTDLADSEQITVSEHLEDATDSGGSGAAAFGSAVSGEVVHSAPGSGAPHTARVTYERRLDVSAARDYLRSLVTIGTTGAGTVQWAAVLDFENDPGGVRIAPLFYDRVDPFPTSADLVAIQALVDHPTFRPLLARPLVFALAPEAQDFEIALTPNTAEVQAAVEAELADLFRREATPGGVLLLSHIREAISLAAGEVDHTLVTPAADVDLAGDLTKISTVGTFTWS